MLLVCFSLFLFFSVPFHLSNFDGLEECKSVPLVPKRAELGSRNVTLGSMIFIEADDAKLLREGMEVRGGLL